MTAPPSWVFAGPIAAHFGPIQYILNAAPHARSGIDLGVPKRLQRFADECRVDHVHRRAVEVGCDSRPERPSPFVGVLDTTPARSVARGVGRPAFIEVWHASFYLFPPQGSPLVAFHG